MSITNGMDLWCHWQIGDAMMQQNASETDSKDLNKIITD